jgi:two-component system, OmpR family, phosphate regulon sensor histidine kinase PhoR
MVSVQAAIESCAGRHEHLLSSKNLKLNWSQPADPVMAFTDDEALAEILDDLLDNAIKYTLAGGQITLRWFTEDAEAVIEVQDSGIGISEKHLPRIFERFYRVDKARSSESGSTGLGLSIIKHLVQSLGGRVTASSQVGVGSTFIVRLPNSDCIADQTRLNLTGSA